MFYSNILYNQENITIFGRKILVIVQRKRLIRKIVRSLHIHTYIQIILYIICVLYICKYYFVCTNNTRRCLNFTHSFMRQAFRYNGRSYFVARQIVYSKKKQKKKKKEKEEKMSKGENETEDRASKERERKEKQF